MTETNFDRWAINYLRGLGWYVIKTAPPVESGTPDLLCAVRPSGLFLGIETKRHRNKATKLQRLRMDEIIQSGGLALIARTRQEIRDIARVCSAVRLSPGTKPSQVEELSSLFHESLTLKELRGKGKGSS